MILLSNLAVPVEADPAELSAYAARRLGIAPEAVGSCRAVRCSIDARKKQQIHFLYMVKIGMSPKEEQRLVSKGLPFVAPVKEGSREPLLPGNASLPGPVAVVGLGPAGLFAAYELARHGYRPLVVERGRPIGERCLDVERFWSGGPLDEESNVMFGEGGAGAFSDGKLTTRIKDPRAEDVIKTLMEFGAPESIGVLAKPHIGTDHLRRVVKNLRQGILAAGGEIRFSTRVTGLEKREGGICALILETGGQTLRQECGACVLAIGQGARDTYRMLLDQGLELIPKAFAVGVRAEHPQGMIDRSQYGALAGHPRLGAAEYHLSAKAGGRGVYTFCMCPGGLVVASSSTRGEVVTNGMSDYARDRENANAAVIVQVGPEDFGQDPLAGMEFQRELERAAFRLGGGDYCAPAQTVGDYLKGRASAGFRGVRPSYRPGVRACDLNQCLPPAVAAGIQEGLVAFGRQLRGYDREDAVLTGVETRTSAPVRILRDENGEATRLKGLFPVGEGAGYAGGIVSAAVDGLNAAQRIIARYRQP